MSYNFSEYDSFVTKGASTVKHLEVVAAIIEHEGKILCMQRGHSIYEYVSFKYEYPGGKVEAGEDNPTALERELREEMVMHINISEHDFFLTMTFL